MSVYTYTVHPVKKLTVYRCSTDLVQFYYVRSTGDFATDKVQDYNGKRTDNQMKRQIGANCVRIHYQVGHLHMCKRQEGVMLLCYQEFLLALAFCLWARWRMSLRTTLKATLQQSDNHAIVYWPTEGVVTLSKIAKPPVVGETYEVLIRKKSYSGTTIKIGTRKLMYDSLHKPFCKSACM